MCNLNFLPDFKLGIDCNDLVGFHSPAESVDCCRVDSGEPITELHQTTDSWRMLDRPPLVHIIELRKEITGKHRLDKPDGASPGQFARTQTRRETSYIELLSQPDGREMLAFRLRL
jgi:hypothetical protein